MAGEARATSSTPSTWTRTMLQSTRFAVEIFDGTGHFGIWQGEVLDTLFQQNLDLAVEEKKPDEVDEKEWSTMNRLACGTIRSCLSREQKYAFKNETSAHKLWKALEDKFMKKSGQNKLLMKKRLFRYEYRSGSSLNEHITVFNQLVADLLNLDIEFKDEDLALMLLSSLPDEFEHLETTLLHGKENVSLDAVCSALYSYELRQQEKRRNKTAVADEALVARGRHQNQKKGSKSRSKSKSRVAKDECAFCKEKGHWKKDCPKLKKKGKAPQDANVAECTSETSECSLVVSPTNSHSNEWILDSGCTYHMSPVCEWFFDYEELNGGVVYMGNDNPCKTVGIGSIRLRNQDGSVRVLRNVRYVPTLKKNLISLGALESNGLVVTMRDGMLRATS